MTRISAIIVAHNEEKKIEDCLRSLDFADEIVVVLDKCSDKTKDIVLKYTNKIIEGSWSIEGARRNVAVKAASFEWILEIDADERISKELKKKLLETGDKKIINIDEDVFWGMKFDEVENKLVGENKTGFILMKVR